MDLYPHYAILFIINYVIESMLRKSSASTDAFCRFSTWFSSVFDAENQRYHVMGVKFYPSSFHEKYLHHLIYEIINKSVENTNACFVSFH